jgi:PBP1b-binding outer membrane lipoprotein LpoB
MKKKLTVILLFAIFLTSCKSYWEYQKAKKSGEVTTMKKAYDKFTSEIDSVLSLKMTSYISKNSFVTENSGYYRVENINEEEAPYIVGTIVSLRNKVISTEQLPSMLIDLKYLDTKIKFDKPEISVFVNKSASVNVEALSIAKTSMQTEDKMRIVYDKAFVAQPGELNWFNDTLWTSTIKKYGLRKSDSLWVVKNVQVKKFTYSIYQGTNGQFSATPTPVVAIDGKIFQESGGERNIYEVYIQLSRLRFPIDIAVNPIFTDSLIIKDSKYLDTIKVNEKINLRFNRNK